MFRKPVFLYLLFFSFFISCKKEIGETVNLNGNKITALGHGGMGIGNPYPINSFESVLKCLNLGMDGTELDVQMTKDSILVAYHDVDIADNSNGQGMINNLTWEELKNIHYQETLFLNYSIVSLDDLFSNIEDLSKYKFAFDCKLYKDHDSTRLFYKTYINAMVNIIEKFQLEENVYIEAQYGEFLRLFKNKRPYSFFIHPISFEKGLETALSLDLSGISISTREITGEQIKIAHDHNLMVAIWNTHSESDHMEAINKTPDIIQTDKVRNLIKLLK